MKKKLGEVAPKISDEFGNRVSFAEYMSDQSGMGELYSPTIKEMLDASLDPHTPWDEVDDYLVPIAHHVISEAAEHEDKRIYIRLVLAIREAWEDLNPNV